LHDAPRKLQRCRNLQHRGTRYRVSKLKCQILKKPQIHGQFYAFSQASRMCFVWLAVSQPDL